MYTYKSASTLKQFTDGNISWRGLNTISEFSLLLGSVHSNSSPRDRSRWETSAEPIGARTHAHIEMREHLNRVLLARLQRRSGTQRPRISKPSFLPTCCTPSRHMQ